MARHDQDEAEDLEDDFEGEGDDASEDLGDETDPCPYCGAAIYEDGEWCPKCGKYLTKEDGASTQKTWIVAVTTLLLIAFLIMAALGR